MTLDDDVAAALARRRSERGTGLRQEVNALLRAGLAAIDRPVANSGEMYQLPTFDPGRALIEDHRALRDLLDEVDVTRAMPLRP